MIVYKMPVLTYFEGASTNFPMYAQLFTSNQIINKYQYLSSGLQILQEEDFNAGENVDLIEYVNNIIGDSLLMRGTMVYINDPNLIHVNASAATFGLSCLGLTPSYGTYSPVNNLKPTEVFNINNAADIRTDRWRICGMGGSGDYASLSGWLTNDMSGAIAFGRLGVSTTYQIDYILYVWPERVADIPIDDLPGGLTKMPLQFNIRASLVPVVGTTSSWEIYHVRIAATKLQTYNNLKATFGGIKTIDGPATQEADTDNPYGISGISGTGGGNGHYGDIDSVDGTPIPDLPSISAADLGFITMYNPSKAQLKSLSDFLWSGLFDLDTYKKLFSDPMQSIIGLSIVPVNPSIAGNKNVMFGAIDSGVSMPYLSTQYVQFNCGSVTIEDYVGSFLDYSPYTKISIYLPYIGIHEISPDDIMNDTINVTYNIDVLSGACGAFISSAKKGVLYSYNGSCISNIPLTSINFSSAIQNAVSAVCSGAAMVAGIVTEAAPLTAAGAIGLLGNGANAALNSKPSVQRSGSLGGSAGVLSVQKPYIIIERPNVSVPANVQKMVGQCSNITAYLGNLSGFTMVEYIHLEGIPATDEEIQEIEALLKEGVIL